jgi:hypothetical protein
MRSLIIGRGEPADPEEVGDFGLCENCYDGQQARRRLGSKSTEDSIKPGYGLPYIVSRARRYPGAGFSSVWLFSDFADDTAPSGNFVLSDPHRASARGLTSRQCDAYCHTHCEQHAHRVIRAESVELATNQVHGMAKGSEIVISVPFSILLSR